jgi:hypothetical protein
MENQLLGSGLWSVECGGIALQVYEMPLEVLVQIR